MELIAEYIDTYKGKVFNILICNKIIVCKVIRISTDENLIIYKEEADMKAILHCNTILCEY